MDGTKLDATPKIQNANGGFSNSQDISSQDSFAHAKEDICKRLFQMEARFDAQNSSSKDKDGDMTVTFENEIYRGLHDAKAKATNENGEVILKPKMIWDNYAIFGALRGDLFNYPSNRQPSMDKLSTMKISLHDIHHIMEAYASGLPQFFDSGESKVYVDGTTTGIKTALFNHIPSYSSWGPVGVESTCIRERAATSLNRLRREAISCIKERPDKEVQILLIDLLEHSVTFVKEVFKFMTEEHETWTTCTRVKYPLFQVFSAKYIKIYSI